MNKQELAREVSKWLLGEVRRIMNREKIDITEFRKRVPPENLYDLIMRIDN